MAWVSNGVFMTTKLAFREAFVCPYRLHSLSVVATDVAIFTG
jgi:hypothetical protein